MVGRSLQSITETATVKIISDILMAFNHGVIAALALLDCSAAFDTVDHGILLRKLSESFGVNDTTLQWLTCYVRGRLQCIRYGGLQSEYKPVDYSVPQGLVLGALLFIIYTAELCLLVTTNHLHPHQYADDVQKWLASINRIKHSTRPTVELRSRRLPVDAKVIDCNRTRKRRS